MAVTKATYTATGTWTASQLAGIFESAFVASGLMSSWHDSFTSGSVENRILEVAYDGGATYGTTYYWFMFSTSGAYFSVCTAWNSGSHVPTGTQYLDYFSTTTNSTGNHDRKLTLSSASNVSLIRYTSAIDATQSWYTLVQGSTSYTFTIAPAGFTVAPWVDMDKVLFHHHLVASPSVSNRTGFISIASCGLLRRSFACGGGLVGYTTSEHDFVQTVASYASVGRASNSAGNNISSNATSISGGIGATASLFVPMGNSTANPAYSANFSPVFTGFPFSHYISTPNSAADFGIAFHYANNTMVRGDKLIVTASVEEWEILAVTNNATVTDGASPMFLARVV